MKKMLFTVFLLVTAWTHVHACQVMNVGNKDDNADCSSVLNTIYRLKASVPLRAASQKAYSVLWLDESDDAEPLSILFLTYGKMVSVDFSSVCHSDQTQECLKQAASDCLSSGSNCSIDWDVFTKTEKNGEWFSGYETSWYDATQHLKQYGNYLIGYFAKNFSSDRNYYVVDVTKNNLEVSLSK